MVESMKVRLAMSIGLCLWCFGWNAVLEAQTVDLLLRGGRVYDARNKIDGIMDVAISEGRILEVGPALDTTGVVRIIDVEGLWVSPGLIDIHTHVYVGSQAGKFADGINSLAPDNFTLRAGVTTVVDAGTSGWRTFPKFKQQVIDQSKTRVLAWLNIAGYGMTGDSVQEQLAEMDVDQAVDMIETYPETIVGIKIGHYNGDSWVPFERALEASGKTSRPLFVECHLPQYTLEEQLERMRPGDIITHSYEKVTERASVVDDDKKLRKAVIAARDKGVLFDVGHGGAGFWFSEAIPALEQGLAPNSFGSDMHRFSVHAGMKDMLNIMSKYMAMGMSIRDVLQRATWNAARSIQREDLGHLGPGAPADIVVLSVRDGQFGFVDAGKQRITGSKKLEAELTIREGRIVWDLNGLSADPFSYK